MFQKDQLAAREVLVESGQIVCQISILLQIGASTSNLVVSEEAGFNLWQARHFPEAVARPSEPISRSGRWRQANTSG